MKEAWGSIMPHIMLAEKNLNAILDQVLYPYPLTPSDIPSSCLFYKLCDTIMRHPVSCNLSDCTDHMITTGTMGFSRGHFRRSSVDPPSQTTAFPRWRAGDDDRFQHGTVRQRVQCGERALVQLSLLSFLERTRVDRPRCATVRRKAVVENRPLHLLVNIFTSRSGSALLVKLSFPFH